MTATEHSEPAQQPATTTDTSTTDVSTTDEPTIAGVLGTLRTLLDEVHRYQPREGRRFTDELTNYLGTDANTIAVVRKEIDGHRFIDIDLALQHLAETDPDHRVIGVTGGDMRYHVDLADMLNEMHGERFNLGQPDYVHLADGPDSERTCLGFGVRLFTWEQTPVAVLLRQAMPRYGRERASLDVLCSDTTVAQRLLTAVDTASIENSLLRGKVISLAASGFEHTTEGVTFIARPDVTADDVILPAGVLDRITEHVVGIAEHRDELRRLGQHLKRGVLLYGPPGSGKTHTVRHLMSITPSHTCLVLSGETLRFIGLAAHLARALQPALVVLEDCDLIAEDRDYTSGAKPLLFEVLDAMDGLDADADVTFLLTTNRVESMERALTQRPGRVDLAVEIPVPDAAGREQLLRLYSPAPDTFSEAAITETAELIDGTTASFTKELVRRAVLASAIAGESLGDDHLVSAARSLMSDAEELSRVLLGHPSARADEDGPGEDDGWPPVCGCST